MSAAVTNNRKTHFRDEAVSMWPSLPYMAFGLWSAWSSITYSGSLWLSDSEVDGTYLTQLYIISTFACALIFLAGAVFARRGSTRFIAQNRVIMSGGIIAGIGCLFIVFIGPYYLGSIWGSPFVRIIFWIGAAASGLGTGLIGLRCGMLYGTLSPRRALIYTALSQLVAVFVYLVVFACPRWALVEHGPAFTDIIFFCLLPLAAAALACLDPTSKLGPNNAASPSAISSANASEFTANVRRLPAVFWRFVALTFCLCLITSMVRSNIVTTHALASTLEGNNLLMVLSAITACTLIVYGLRGNARGIGLGRVCSLLAVCSAMIMIAIAAFGGLTNEWSLVAYLASGIFELMMWCILAFIVAQKHVSAIVVFGWGRGLFLFACGLGWLLGAEVLPLVPEDAITVFYIVLAAFMLLAALGLFSERDVEHLFSAVSEEDLSLEDLFDREHQELFEGTAIHTEKRGRFKNAIKLIADRHYLSAREAEVLRLLAMGYSSERIAETMAIKVNTARVHTHNVYIKLDVHSREELMILVDQTIAKL